MLQLRTIDPGTLGLLKSLVQDPLFADNFLVGGTALALQMGHRFSVDLDLFTHYSFDAEQTETPVVFDKKVTWAEVKKRMVQVVRDNF